MKSPSGNALAYSYLRFSSSAQADGDSVRRQTALRDGWLKRHPEARLDTSLRLEDHGVSGYTGAHRKNKKHALAAFLDLVERGRVPEGSYLIVENLDRLTREEPVVSIPLVLNLIAAGVRIVQLAPVEIVYDAAMEQHHLMNMLWELSRGHGESKRKSGLCGEAWRAKKDKARADKTPYGKMCPAWLELADGKYRVKADAARAVRKVFEWSAAGLGTFAILERLNREKVPPIGRSGAWDRSYVRKILNSVAAIGVYQPMKGSRTRVPEGDPVENFYPAVITDALWYAARGAAKARERRSGRPATAAVNPFSGLLYHAADGGKLHVCGSRGHKYLVSENAVQKRGAGWVTFPLDPFVSGVLKYLREVATAEVFADPNGSGVTGAAGRLRDAETRLAVATAKFEADPESTHWQGLVDKYDRERRALARELAELRQQAANPLPAAWDEAVQHMANDDPVRLRAALLQTVAGVWCVFAAVGRTRLAYAQVWFEAADGSPPTQSRTYLIAHRPPVAGAAPPRPAVTYCASVASTDGLLACADLRDPAEAAAAVQFLERYPRDLLDRLLKKGTPVA